MAKKKLKICFVCDSQPKKNEGASLRVYYEYINYFIQKKYKVILICHGEKLDNETFRGEKLKIYLLQKQKHLVPNRFHIINNLKSESEILSIVRKNKCNIIIAFDIVSISQLSNCKDFYKIGWLGDLRFLTNKHNFYYSVKENFKNIKNIFYNLYQNYLIKNFYKNHLALLNEIIVSSNSSVAFLKKIGFTSKFLTYPWSETFNLNKKKIKKPTFLFFGNLSGLGSRSSIIEIFNSIYPKLKKKFGNGKFQILIGGKNHENSYLNKIELNRYPEIKNLGFINDIDSIASKCHAFIFPGKVPIGNRSRLLSCLSSGILIIASKSVTLGNNLFKNKYNSLIAKNSNEFVDLMYFAYKNKNIVNQLKKNGKKTYMSNYEPREASRKLEEIILNSQKKFE